MADLKYRKNIIIERKIIKEDDILLIAKLVHEQFQPEDYEEEYEIWFDDESRITGNNLDVFKTDEFKRRRSKRISYIYRSKHYDKEIEIRLYNYLVFSVPSEIEICSKDREWFNSICNKILTIVNDMEKQKFSISSSAKLLALLSISTVEGLLLSFSLYNIFSVTITDFDFSIISGILCMILVRINIYFIELIEKAYPNVEFAFGPDYLNKSQKIRKCMWAAAPFAIDLILFALGYID